MEHDCQMLGGLDGQRVEPTTRQSSLRALLRQHAVQFAPDHHGPRLTLQPFNRPFEYMDHRWLDDQPLVPLGYEVEIQHPHVHIAMRRPPARSDGYGPALRQGGGLET